MNTSRDSSHHSSFLSYSVSVAILSFYLWSFPSCLTLSRLGCLFNLLYCIDRLIVSHPVLDTCLTACPIQ